MRCGSTKITRLRWSRVSESPQLYRHYEPGGTHIVTRLGLRGRKATDTPPPGAVVSDEVRRHGLSPQHLSAWRRAARAGLLKLADVETPVCSGVSTMRHACSSSSGEACGALGGPCPRHELVETRSWPEIDQPGEDVGQIGLRVDATELAGLDERGDAGPILRALIMPGEERILAIKNNRADASFDNVGVELDSSVIEEAREPVPVVQGVADVLGDGRLGRDAGELLLEPRLERQHQSLLRSWRAARRSSALRPRIVFSIAYRAAMRSSASLAIGAGPLLAMS